MTFETWMNWGFVIGVPSYFLFVFIFIVYKRIRDARYLPTFDSNGNGHMVFFILGLLPCGVFGGIILPFILVGGMLYLSGLLAMFIGDRIRKFLETGIKNDTER